MDIGIFSKYSKPLWTSVGSDGDIVFNSYGHSIKAIGGYWSCSMELNEKYHDTDDWFINGIGRDITAYNNAGIVIWNGFVNSVTTNVGTLTAKIGPLLDVTNRARVVYSTIDTNTSPPVVGIRAKTAYSDDTASQSKYGIIEKVLSTGGANSTTANQIRDAYLADHSYPEVTQNVNIGREGVQSTTIECLGYVHWLNAYTYSSTNNLTRSYTNRITDVLGADPNSIFSTNYS